MHDNTNISQEQIAAIQKENDLLWQLINSIPHHLYIKDHERRFVIANRAVLASFNGDSEDIIGKSDEQLHAPDVAEDFISEEAQLLATGEAIHEKMQLTYHPQTNQAVWLSASKQPLYDADNHIVGLMGFAEDITAQKQLQEERDHNAKMLIEKQKALLEVSTPVLPVSDDILLIPLIGSVDSMRALHIMRTVLNAISTYHARILILDISGMPVIDTSVANDLNRMIQAAALKGTEAIITGVSDAVAETIVDLGIDWSEIETLRDLQSGIQRALQKQHRL